MDEVPIGKRMLLIVPEANHLLKFPTIVPEVLDNEPKLPVPVPKVRTFEPVVILPLVNVSAAGKFTDVFNVNPEALFKVKLIVFDIVPPPV